VAVTAVLILLLTTGSTMAASSNAMPDQTLYPVKLATEEMRLALAVTDTQKAQIHTQLAETRAVEVETMADNGNTEQAAFATERLIAELERANAAIAKVEGTAIPIPIPIPIPEPTPTVTPPEETITPPQETTTTTPPEETVTPPQETTATTPPEETITPPQETTTTTPPEETVTPPQETTATTPPEETVTPPEETTTPPDSTKGKTTSTQKTERFKKSLENSTSKSLTALKNAHEKASEQAKPDWQQSIDTISKSYHKQTHEHGTGQSDNTTGKSDNTTTKQWGTSNNVSPNQSQYPSWNWQNHR
jgi:hypothetical protein